MSDEQDIGKGGDQVKFDRTERTAESTAEDSVIAGDRKHDHQQRHQEMKDSGRTFKGMNMLYQQETGNQVDDGSGAPSDESVTIVALGPDGKVLKASSNTGYKESDLAEQSITTSNKDTRQIALKDNDLDQTSEVADLKPSPPVSTSKMIETARREHDHPTRWKVPPHKCNQFLDKVAHEAGMPLPWKPGDPPRSFQMNDLLNKSKDFDRVWQADYSNPNLTFETFKFFQMQPGDLIVWDVPANVYAPYGISHSGIATADRQIIYAGSERSKNGCGHCDIKYFVGYEEPTNYGPPTAIFRYKNMQK